MATRADVEQAIRLAGATAPGPDGILVFFLKGLASLGVSMLTDALHALGQSTSGWVHATLTGVCWFRFRRSQPA